MYKLIRHIIFSIAFIICCILAWGVCNKNNFMYLENIGITEDIYKYGDLYSNLHLKKYRTNWEKENADTLRTNAIKNTNIHIYLYGDSYTQEGRLQQQNLHCDSMFRIYTTTPTIIDSSKKNILLIEKTERYFREWIATELLKNNEVRPSSIKTFFEQNPNTDIFSTKQMNQRIEYIISNNLLIRFLKEQKANLQYSLFGQATNLLYISQKTGMVYLSETIDSSNMKSCFNTISLQEATTIINCMNNIYTTNINNGFDDVLFSIIPDKPRIYNPIAGYEENNLYTILDSSKKLFTHINCTDALKKETKKTFLVCDTHWNHTGINCWLQVINSFLKNISTSKKLIQKM